MLAKPFQKKDTFVTRYLIGSVICSVPLAVLKGIVQMIGHVGGPYSQALAWCQIVGFGFFFCVGVYSSVFAYVRLR